MGLGGNGGGGGNAGLLFASAAVGGDGGLEVQLLLFDAGKHRGPSIPDLLIAATAELVGLTVLQVDKDFNLISKLTGQLTECLNVG